MFPKEYSSKSELSHVDLSPQSHTRTYKKWGECDHIFDMITDPIIVFDVEFNIVKMNKAAKLFFTGYPIGKKCFFIKHKFALACKSCPTWQTIKTGTTATSEILSPKTGNLILLKTYPVHNRLKKIKGVVLVGRESDDVPVKWKRQKAINKIQERKP